jgi:hypothetical protein
MDLSKLPKQFCDNVNLGYSQEFFIAALLSGQNMSVFAFTPEHMKRLSLSLQYHIEEFEKSFGEIQTQWSPGIQSPIQMIDLNKAKGGEDKEK